MGFVLKGFQGFGEVKCLEQFHRGGRVITEFRDTVEVSRDQSEKHQEKDEDDDWVEEPFFLELKLERAVDDFSYE